MDITLRETLYVTSSEREHVIRQGTIGVLRNRTVFFYDTTKTIAVGVDRDFCIENKGMFSVSKNLSDSEISIKQVEEIIRSTPPEELQNSQGISRLIERIKSI